MTARTSYGLDTPRGTHWTADSACHGPGVDPDWWWPTEHGTPTAATRMAVHICRQHCPVIGRCDQHTQEHPPSHPVVLGGQRYATANGGGGGRLRPAPLAVPDTYIDCPYCRESS